MILSTDAPWNQTVTEALCFELGPLVAKLEQAGMPLDELDAVLTSLIEDEVRQMVEEAELSAGNALPHTPFDHEKGDPFLN